MNYITPFLNLIMDMAPYLLLGFLLAGVLHSFIPQGLYSAHLGKNNFGSVVKAALFGIPLPLCSCGVIPTAASLRKSGASKGATVSFLIATPQTGVDSIIATYSLLGGPFAVLRPIAALVTALLGGSVVNGLCKCEKGDAEATRMDAAAPSGTFWQKLSEALRYGFVDMMRDIGRWLVIGLIVAGAITILVPDNFFSSLSQWPLLNMLLVLVLSLPMYLCATGSIPIAAALMLKGLSPGAALVLLMAGPATNVAAIMVVRQVLGGRATVLYLLSIVVGAVAFGLGVDYLLPTEWFVRGIVATDACCLEGLLWWKVASGVVFVALLLYALLSRKPKKSCCHSHEAGAHQHASSGEQKSCCCHSSAPAEPVKEEKKSCCCHSKKG